MLLWLIIIAAVIILDQVSKWLVVANMQIEERIPLIDGVLEFWHRKNPGAAFGIFDEPDERWIFMTISTVAIIGLGIYLWKSRKESKALCAALSMIIGGGIGNMIDRCFLGEVTDFIYFAPINFPVFNLADSFVCIGVGLFALCVILEEIKVYKKERAEKLAAEAEVVADMPENEPVADCEAPKEEDAENGTKAD